MNNTIKLNAGNDTSGNPRRCFVVLDGNRTKAVIDEGYNGTAGLKKIAGGTDYALELMVTPKTLKELYATAKKMKIFHAS